MDIVKINAPIDFEKKLINFVKILIMLPQQLEMERSKKKWKKKPKKPIAVSRLTIEQEDIRYQTR